MTKPVKTINLFLIFGVSLALTVLTVLTSENSDAAYLFPVYAGTVWMAFKKITNRKNNN